MKPYLLIGLAYISILNILFGQEEISPINTADELFKQYKFKESAEKYQEVFVLGKMNCDGISSSEALFQYGQALLYVKENKGHEILGLAEDCIKKHGTDSLYANFLNTHAEIYRIRHNFELAKPYLWKILKLKNLDPILHSRNFAALAISSRHEKSDSTLHYANRALEIALAKQDTTSITQSYIALALWYNTTNNLHQSIFYNREALKFLKGSFAKKRPEIFGNLANLFTTIGDYPRATKYVDSVYQTIDTTIFKNFFASVQYTEARIFRGQNQDRAAIPKFKKAVTTLSNFNNRLTARIGLIESYLAVGEISLAKKELIKATQQIEETNFDKYQSRFYYLKSLLALHSNNPKEAIEFANIGLTIRDKNIIQSSRTEIHKILATTYESEGEIKKSLEHYKLYYNIKDSLKNKSDNSMVYTLESEFTAVDQDRKLAQLETKNAIQDVKFNQQRWQGIALMGILGLLAISITSLARQHKKINRQTETIKNTIEEKNILLKEIHHRVKNNLQVITSLFKLQSRYLDEGSAMNALNEGRNRVNSLAILHQNLYQEDNLKGVRMDNYIEQLCDALFANNKKIKDNIIYKNNCENLVLDIDTVIPLGLILTELISASLKNKYNDQGIISVFLTEENEHLKLEVENNGSYAIETEDVDFLNSFSQKIIQAFSKKLKATYSTSRNGTNRSTLLVKNYKKAN